MSIDKVRGTDTLTLRLTKEDRAALDELVEAARVELEPRGVVVSAALYVRGLIRTAHSGMASGAPATVPAAAPAPTPPATAPAPAPAPKTAPKTAERTAEEVRRKLKASKLTQAELSRLTGIDTAMLSRFKSGKKPLSPEKLARLAVALGG